MTEAIAGLSRIADRFDAVLVDQFGVLHDGVTAYDGALACLRALRAREVRIAAVTNSGKRAAANATRLAKFGFTADLFDTVISSGELARAHVCGLLDTGDLAPGARVAVISRDADMATLEGLGLELGPPGGDAADLVLIAGAEPETTALDAYGDALAPSAASGIPAICANPDHWMQTSAGIRFGAGQIARRYEELGGRVTMLGKPSASIFLAALAALGHPEPERTLMIGDSPAHDIAGAASVGVKTLLVTSGPQSDTAGGSDPDYEIPSLVW